MATTLTVFEGWDLDVTEAEEPRARDLDIGERAGMDRPREIRTVIHANWDLLTAHGEIRVCGYRPQTSSGGRPGTEYWLNEAQALALASVLRTPAARALHASMVRVFVAWRRGLLSAPAAPLPLDVAHGIRLRDNPLLRGEMRALCGMTARATGRTLQAIYGFVRKTYRVGSPFDVAAMAWPIVKSTLEAAAAPRCAFVRLPTEGPVQW